MTPHIEARKEEIAKNVLMPGDPLRAKYIAENYLENFVLVSSIRNIYAYTGIYKGKKITIMASGMGNSSIGIYSYELYKFYEVENIIRIGTTGAYEKNLNLKDIILAEKSYSESTYALCLNNNNKKVIEGDKELNKKIKDKALEKGIQLYSGTVHCSDMFYKEGTFEHPEKYDCLSVEMESFALFANAEFLGKKAACILTVSDKINEKEELTPEEREKSLKTMIELALDTI